MQGALYYIFCSSIQQKQFFRKERLLNIACRSCYITIILSRDTPVTPYICLPVSTDLAIRDRSRDCRNLRQFTAICYILPCSAIFCLPVSTVISAISATSVTSAEFYQVYQILPSSARTMTWSLFCPIYMLTE